MEHPTIYCASRLSAIINHLQTKLPNFNVVLLETKPAGFTDGMCCFVVVLVGVLLVERNSIRIIVIAFKIIRVDYQNVFCCCCFLLTFFHLHNGLCLFCLRQCLKCNGKLSEQTTLYM